ncbi:hypothetical protein Cylst_2961 [Cylindrospermum stagnale PCC 7417]|uniref:Uncharacterized protein n=1 Tax=Cylindrospermum stagnale PCC 7417 TaxID=56107 RepID=K9WY69_9NOST|nr:hypothetical protein [Cylindrospermum stagnale]AFZ25133.1 hypothetical protein Cylst_2961 [Cylindrospermum stagnale PCC 7417]
MKKLNRVKAALGATEQAWGVILKQIEQNGILRAGNQRDYGISKFTKGKPLATKFAAEGDSLSIYSIYEQNIVLI